PPRGVAVRHHRGRATRGGRGPRRLMAPGHFARRALEAGGCFVSAPLGAHPDVARLVPERFDGASAEPVRRTAVAATRTA
ncbi:hypothetical protein ACFVH0_15250, partial [Streptomyces sp. NPDC127117]